MCCNAGERERGTTGTQRAHSMRHLMSRLLDLRKLAKFRHQHSSVLHDSSICNKYYDVVAVACITDRTDKMSLLRRAKCPARRLASASSTSPE